MFQIVITIILVASASLYALYQLYRSIVPGKQSVKRGCATGCPHCLQ